VRLLSPRVRTESLLRHPVSYWLIIAVVSSLAILPFCWFGTPSGHDFEFHLNSWMDVLAQWKQGVIYPRWAALAYWGYGEPRFLFYPPFSWMLGATLGSILPWNMVPGACCWLALTLAGAGMYRLAREWLGPADALFAAAFYALNPYHLLVVYWRSAYAELLCAGLLPLLLLLVVRINDNLGRFEWARDDDTDGWFETHTNSQEGLWAGLRTFLRPFRGVHKRYLYGYVAIHEFSVNLKAISPDFISRLVCRYFFCT